MNQYKKCLYALDLAMECSGVAIFDLNNNSHYPLYFGHIKTNPYQTHGDRLYQIVTELHELTQIYKPHLLVIEDCFIKHNKASKALFKVHGAINCMFRKHKQIYYQPATIKATILHGKATKEQIQNKIIEVFSDLKFNNYDESDAVAIGLTYFIKKCGMDWKK